MHNKGIDSLVAGLIISLIFLCFIMALFIEAVAEVGLRAVLLHPLSVLWGTFVLCLSGGTVAWLCFVYQSAIDRKAVPVDGRLAGLIYIMFMVGIITLILSVLKGESFEWLRTCFGLFPPLKYR
ncbi:MAG: hypothetical protein WAN43_16950 [Rhodomicrobium sp.]